MKKIFSLLFTLVSVFALINLSGCTISKVESSDSSTSATSNNKNAYELAVENGFQGDLNDWLESLVSNEAYKSIYDLAVDNGLFTGTLEEFINSLKGEKGENGSTDIEKGSAYAVNSVVSVYCNFSYTYSYRDWWGRVQSETSTYSSAGSGVIFDDDKENGIAYIITNYHVVYDSSSSSGVSDDIYIYLYGMEYTGYKISAKYIGGSSNYDIAVLKIESDIYKDSGAYKATIASSSNLAVGSKVIAIGNPEAEGISVTAGVVSVPNENITTTSSENRTKINTRVIRIDAAVNSGNSGGGLFDSNGNLIGIVNAKEVDEDIEGMCYAIPINVGYAIAKKIVNTCDGEKTTTITTTLLGASTEIISSRADYDSETCSTKITQVMAVSDVESSGASKGLLKENDILVSITYNGITYEINNLYSIEDVLLLTSKGDTVTMTITRNNTNMAVDIVLSYETNVE